MSRRWGYMGSLNYNRPNNDCPKCENPSRVYHVGARTIERDGQLVAITRWECEHKHEWTTEELR